jgi:gamma-glutamyl hercynylcysteine S-oxide synthase
MVHSSNCLAFRAQRSFRPPRGGFPFLNGRRTVFPLCILLFLSVVSWWHTDAQVRGMKQLDLAAVPGLAVVGFGDGSGTYVRVDQFLPMFTVEVNDTVISSLSARAVVLPDSAVVEFPSGIAATLLPVRGFRRGWKGTLIFRNQSIEKKKIANLVPLGRGGDRVYIDANQNPQTGPNRLSRSRLFRPGYGPVGVVLPDNAWEMGFCDVAISPNQSLTALCRRTRVVNGDERRFHCVLNPGGSVTYDVYVDMHTGEWHAGLQMMVRERWIYDLEHFDNTLFERKDLGWARHAYLMLLQFAWDKTYYHSIDRRYYFDSMLVARDSILGKFDVYCIWPTWPRLGLDERNQFDLYRDLPGGLKELRRQAEVTHTHSGKYFISYNPWDQSTRHEDHLRGMEDLLRAIDADGVVLDTRGESSKEFQNVADRVKPGIVMYSEGMAVPKDMPGIVAGRVHDAIYMPPPLNLNKYIKPEFAIFRVMQVMEGKLHRESALCLFNGYGAELNIMRPGRPDWMDDEFRYLGRCLRVLRENSPAFLAPDWTPLLPTTADSVWVNRWSAGSKTIFTIYSLRPDGFLGPLTEALREDGFHYVDLWHHEEVNLVTQAGRTYLPAKIDGFSGHWLGTREEGNVDVVALLPQVLTVSRDHDSLHIDASRGTKVVVWAGAPSYDGKHADFPIGGRTISLREHLGAHEEKFVVQLFDREDLLDERIVVVPLATPRLVSNIERTTPSQGAPKGMVTIPGGEYSFVMSAPRGSDSFMGYPDFASPRKLVMRAIFMDAYPVTNKEFQIFLRTTRYRPADTTNFLKHWVGGKIPTGKENHPVVYVGIEDARAYARWAGKRLPTGAEWQYAAQGTDGRKYPWGNTFDSTRCNNALNSTTAVEAFPAGKSPFGVMDLVGNVWQMTADVYDNGSNFYRTLRGGSYYYPRTSEWYVVGGPWPVDQHQMLLMVSPGFDRSATIGFRCVMDVQEKNGRMAR